MEIFPLLPSSPQRFHYPPLLFFGFCSRVPIANHALFPCSPETPGRPRSHIALFTFIELFPSDGFQSISGDLQDKDMVSMLKENMFQIQ